MLLVIPVLQVLLTGLYYLVLAGWLLLQAPLAGYLLLVIPVLQVQLADYWLVLFASWQAFFPPVLGAGAGVAQCWVPGFASLGGKIILEETCQTKLKLFQFIWIDTLAVFISACSECKTCGYMAKSTVTKSPSFGRRGVEAWGGGVHVQCVLELFLRQQFFLEECLFYI